MGGKSSTATSSTGIPQEVLDRYNAVNAQAQAVAQTPFQQYSQDASAFVAPLTSTQIAGIQNTNQMAGAAQPFYGAATGLTLAGAGPVNAGQIGDREIGQYMSPYLNSVVGTTMANLRQQQQQEQTGELGNQISRGAFGGDRGRIAQANLARQQNLATGQTVSGLMNQGYGQALQTAQQQQGVNLGAEQANLARLMQAGQQIAGLGAGAQAAGLQGAQAQLAAGTAEQQTNQAGQTALYNQFLQQQGYPFQVAQFLANIAMGTGALSGQTTTTQQPSSLFSDKRLKEDIEPIGETYDGQKIVKFRYKGEPGKQIGLIAQDVEKHHPEAVGLAGGYKTVDYDKATKHAADKGHYLHGGLVSQSEGGAVYEDRAGQGYAKGGETSVDMAEILALLSPQKTRTPYGKIGLYGQASKAAGPYGSNLGLEDTRSLAVRPVRELSLDDSRYVRPPAFAYGGLAPDGYASGGLPYNQAEGEYVPEDISDMRQTPAKLDSPKSVPGKSGSDFQTAMDMAKIAAMFMQDGGVAYASGGLVPHMAYGGSSDFASLLAERQKMYENTPGAKGGVGGLNIPQQMQRRPEMLRPSPMASNVKSSTELAMADLNSAGNAASTIKGGYDLGKEAMFGSRARPELRNKSGDLVREEVEGGTGLFSSQNPGESGYFKQAIDYLSSQFASGGLVPRHGYAEGGNPDFNIPAVPEGANPAAHIEIYNAAKAEQAERDKEEARKLTGGLTVSDAQLSDPRPEDAERNAAIKAAIDTINQNNPPPSGTDDFRSDAPPATSPQANLGTPASPPEIRSGLYAGDQASGNAQSALGRANLTDLKFDYNPDPSGVAPPVKTPVAQGTGPATPVVDSTSIKSIRDVNFEPYNRTERTLLPILMGLGTMVESPSRYLGSAFLSGVKGGAKAYGEMQKEMSEAGKASQRIGNEQENVDALNLQRSLELMKYYTDGAEPFFNLKGESMVRIPKLNKVMTSEEYNKQLSNVAEQAQGISAKFNAAAFLAGTGAPAPGTGAPATGTGAGTPGARAGETPVRGQGREVLVDERMIKDPNMRPTNIAAQIETYKRRQANEANAGIPNPETQKLINDLQARYDGILKGEILPLQEDGTPYAGFKNAVARETAEAAARTTKTNEATEYLSAVPSLDRAVQSLVNIYASTDMAGKTPIIADFLNNLSTIPGFGELVAKSPWLSAIRSADPAARKDAVLQAAQMVATNLSGAPASGLAALLQAVAEPEMTAGAKFNVLASQQATQDYERDKNRSYIETEPKPTWDKFVANFEKENSIEKYKDKVIDKMPIFAGMSPDDMFKFAKLNTPERISAARSTNRITLEQAKDIIKQHKDVFLKYLPKELPETLEPVN